MPGDGRIEDRDLMMLQRVQRARLVGAHQAGVSDHVGGKDGRQTPVGLVAFGHARIGRGYSSAAPAVGKCAGTYDVAYGSEAGLDSLRV
jgi:hypothetical protein